MGLLHPGDWQAQWIGLKGGDETLARDPARTRLPARMLRREFDASKKIRRATVYAVGLGFFDLYLNGARVGDHIMDPALTEYNKLILYVTFDVTHQIREGANALGVGAGQRQILRSARPATRLPQYSRTMATRGCCSSWKLNTRMARASAW